MRTGEVTELALVPGSGCDERLFAPQIDALGRVARAHVVENTAESRIDRLARSALGRLPDRFALAGLSQGGLIALEIVRQAPERRSRPDQPAADLPDAPGLPPPAAADRRADARARG